jgi:UDP-N-acetylmuramoylalanine--D-glutamate ligase
MPLVLMHKQVVVVGLGLTGLSCVKYLLKQGAKVIGFDQKDISQRDLPEGARYSFGELNSGVLQRADLIVLSPGVPLSLPAIQQAQKQGIKIVGDIELFALVNKTPVIAITGSNGKSTVTSLISMMIKADNKKVITAGNIGQPILELVDQEADYVVLELSSFQLESTFSLTPEAAVVLNVTEDHLDRYDSFAHYRQTKLRIYAGAKHCIANFDDCHTYPNGSKFVGFGYENKQGIYFDGRWITDGNQRLLDFSQGQLVGEHNVLNAGAAVALAQTIGLSNDAMQEGFNQFAGLPHRCQLVAVRNGVSWVNDSKATNIAATIAAISGLKPSLSGQLHLIAGGDGKGADFRELAPVLKQNISTLIVIGQDGQRLAAQFPCSIAVHSMSDAVNEMSVRADNGDMVLLSPACASIDMFDNYQQRGDCFTRAVKGLSA